MKKGKREAVTGGWQREGDPFQEEKRAPRAKKVKKEKNRYGWHGMSTGKKVGVVTACCLAALVTAAVGWWLLFVRAPAVGDNVRPGVSDKTPSQQNPQDGSASQAPEDGVPDAVSGRKKDVYTFLLLGKDTAGGGNTDTMILVSYDVPNGTVNCLSIPRDTMINVTWSIKKINAVFASKRGIEGLKEEVGHLTGIVPDFYVTVEWEAVGEIVEALGGVEFDVPYNMDYDDPTPGQDLHIHQKKGLRKLSGDDAMQVIRWRKNNAGSNGKRFEIGDTGRQQIQQDFLKAVAKQCLQIGNWTKISQFARIFFENVETDLPLENLLWFAQKAMGINMDNVAFHSMPGNLNGYYNHQSYVFADPAGMVELMNEHFNPYSQEITESDLQIMYKTKSGGLGVTNGTLASSKMANPPASSSSSAPKDPEPADEPALPDPGTTADPGTTDPGAAGSGTTDPGTTGPDTTNPGTTDPGTTDPGTTDPGTTDPGTTDPGTTDPGTTDPGTTDPGTTDPGVTDPGTTDPGTAIDPGAADPGAPSDPGPAAEPETPSDPTADPDPEPVLPEE